MAGVVARPKDPSGADPGGRHHAAYLVMGAMVLLLVVIVVVGVTAYGGDDEDAQATGARAAQVRNLPVYWTVRRGDTFDRIAKRTGLSIGDLETFNPTVDPSTIQPGQRLKLRANVPKPKRRPVGPKYVTVRSGDSYGSIAAKTGKDITRLQQLNPKLKAAALQPGDRVRLR